jgi:hypothetical protein
MFALAIGSIVILLIYNFLTGRTGKYVDHSKLIWSMLTNNPQSGNTKQYRDSSGEIECRRVAEKLTGKAFPKKRPSFLHNKITNSNLELDCYCEELRIAIEYNGKQHYEYVPYFHASKDAFYNTKYRDDIKNKLCCENNVVLITVPYTIPINKIENYIYNKFKERNII